MFSVGILRNSVVGHECFFKCCAMELVSERWIVSLIYIYIYIYVCVCVCVCVCMYLDTKILVF